MHHDKDRARAVRRHHRLRLIRLRRRLGYWGYERHEWDARRLGLVLNTPHPCSHWCCGNQRHAWGRCEPTLRERKLLQHDLAELLEDVDAGDGEEGGNRQAQSDAA